MCHVAAARCSLHVPEIMGKVDDEGEVNHECISDPASLNTSQDCKAAQELDRCYQVAKPTRWSETTPDKIEEPFKRSLIEVEPGIDVRKRQIPVNDEHS